MSEEVPSANSSDEGLPLESSMYISDEDDSFERIKRGIHQLWKTQRQWWRNAVLSLKIHFEELKLRRETAALQREVEAMKIEEDAKEKREKAAGLEIPEPPTFEVMEVDLDELEGEPIPESEIMIGEDIEFSDAESSFTTLEENLSSWARFEDRFVKPKVLRAVNFFYGTMIFSQVLLMMETAFDLVFLPPDLEWFVHLISDRYLRPYGSTLLVVEARALAVSLFFTLSAAFLFFGISQRASYVFLWGGMIVSLVMRLHPAWFQGLGVEDYAHLVFDCLGMVMFGIACSIPMFTKNLLYRPLVLESRFETAGDSTHSYSEEPQRFTDESPDENAGEGVPQGFDVVRPTPPKRRQPGSYSLYEILFLLISMVFWPIAIAVHIVLALEIPTRLGTWTMEASGMKALTPLYAVAIICSFLVLRMDRDARAGEVYAKEKAAYHADMDQYLALKQTYYERKAAEVAGTPNGEE